MATTRIMPLHVGKGRTESRAISDIIDYVANPKKTDNGRLITGYACDSRTADAEFLLAKRQYIAATGRVRGADDVIAYHVRQSFRPGEITPEEANRLGVEFAKRFTKCIFYSAERSELITYNPCVGISAKGGKPTKKKDALTDQQVEVLLDTVKGLPPYLFIMICLYSGLRREEALGLQWDCVFLDAPTPYISVRRAWRSEHNRPVVSTVLKTPAAKRDIPIPKCLVDCLREAKENSISDYVIADSKGEPLAYSQFQRVWQYVVVRSTKPRNYYKYVNGESIKYTVTPTLGMTQKNQPKIKYTLDFDVIPHQLRHTYITNLLYAGVDPKTVQYLAGHENSKTTMDIYAKVKYNKPEELFEVVNDALHQRVSD